MPRPRAAVAAVLLAVAGLSFAQPTAVPPLVNPATNPHPAKPSTVELLPNEALLTPFKDVVPVTFVTKNQPGWAALPQYWNDATEEAIDPATGEKLTRKVVKIKVPLGLTAAPPVPAENPITLAKWSLGKQLYFHTGLSSDNSVSCSSCHQPGKGWSDGARTSSGIRGMLGGVNSPTVVNSAYNRLQFWDGRAASLEEQAQGPVGNPKEMFGPAARAAGGPEPDAWEEAVERLRASPEWVRAFERAFGTAPTRDSAAKAIAAFERTVLVGNALHDKAEARMRKRVADEETGKFELTAADYEAALKDAFAAKDANALAALGLDPERDAAKAGEVGGRLLNGRTLLFGKARCTNCHVGDTYSDGGFHNLGVGVVNGELPRAEFGRYAALPTGHKDANLVGAFKTPGLRALLSSAPYMHSGDETTLEQVIDFYNRGGNANPFLSEKMRDTAAEAAYLKARAAGQPVDPAVATFGPSRKPIIPLKLNLTDAEKADLVLFLKALQGDPVDPVVADPTRFPDATGRASR